jgi:hypothetical protein
MISVRLQAWAAWELPRLVSARSQQVRAAYGRLEVTCDYCHIEDSTQPGGPLDIPLRPLAGCEWLLPRLLPRRTHPGRDGRSWQRERVGRLADRIRRGRSRLLPESGTERGGVLAMARFDPNDTSRGTAHRG